MKFHPALVVGMLALVSSLASAQEVEVATSESRDAATAFIGSMQFSVGRIGRDCLASLNRKQTPQEFVESWLQRNSKYTNAASKYVQARLEEAAKNGESAKNAVMQDLAAVRRNAEKDVNFLFEKNGKEAVCARMVPFIERGSYDIDPRVPIFNEIEALVAWAQRQ